MSHILIPTDFSEASLVACEYALALMGTDGNRYTLMHSYLDPVPGHAEMVQMSSTLYAASVEGLAAFADRFKALPGAEHAVVSTDVTLGILTSVVKDVARRKEVDVVVLGTRGSGGSAFFGSNAGAVAKWSEVPVLVIPQDVRFKGMHSILFADDHRRVEPLAMRPMLQIARRSGAEVIIAHVLRGSKEEPDARVLADYEETLKDVRHRYMDTPGDDVAMALSHLADLEKVDLVTVLHRHTGMLESLFHGSVAKKLAMHTSVPLLVLEH
ncbi:MAG: universal stress protein [Flavobacteriales bacterium]|nr:universal stress protein [Flavobacteriales bacterium]